MDHGSNPIVVFDGACGLCDRVVVFALRHDATKTLRFASSASSLGHDLCGRHKVVEMIPHTLLVFSDDKVLMRSDAIVFIAQHLRFPYSIASIIRFIPRSLRDWGYNLIARNRYALKGEDTRCAVLSEEERTRIIG